MEWPELCVVPLSKTVAFPSSHDTLNKLFIVSYSPTPYGRRNIYFEYEYKMSLTWNWHKKDSRLLPVFLPGSHGIITRKLYVKHSISGKPCKKEENITLAYGVRNDHVFWNVTMKQ